ncbi:MAG: DUF1987 domain-containing protein [Bacteroidota bacterium]|nr:DUF1987 domain-containing protein [Bacteroidota bacterium]
MEKINIEETEFSPKVIFDPQKSKFELSGVSRPEDVVEFFESVSLKIDSFIIDALKNIDNFNEKAIDMKFDLNYINSASSKYILQIIDSFKKLYLKGVELNIQWYFDDDDDQILEDGEDLSDVIQIPFDFIARK